MHLITDVIEMYIVRTETSISGLFIALPLKIVLSMEREHNGFPLT